VARGEGTGLISAALKSHIPGANIVELPLGADHTAIKAAFAEAHPGTGEKQLISANAEKSLPPAAKQEPPAAKKSLELTEEQAKALGLDF